MPFSYHFWLFQSGWYLVFHTILIVSEWVVFAIWYFIPFLIVLGCGFDFLECAIPVHLQHCRQVDLGGGMVHLKPPSPEMDFLSGFVAENVQEGVERYTPPGGVARMHACDRAETCTQPWSMSLSKLRSLIVCSCKGRCTECLEM